MLLVWLAIEFICFTQYRRNSFLLRFRLCSSVGIAYSQEPAPVSIDGLFKKWHKLDRQFGFGFFCLHVCSDLFNDSSYSDKSFRAIGMTIKFFHGEFL